MKIRMKTLMAGPRGVRHPGEVCTLPQEEAAMLVEFGFAEIEPEEIREEEKQIEQKPKKK